MDAHVRRLSPIAVALHTRDHQEDYCWFAQSGHGELTESHLKTLHRTLIADQDARPAIADPKARPASTFALVIAKERVGLLVANLKTSRQDHSRTHIDDTVVLEFKANVLQDVLHVAAGLLTPDALAIQRKLLEYGEEVFRQKQHTGMVDLEDIAVPLPTSTLSSDTPLAELPDHVAIRATDEGQQKVARHLQYLANHPEHIQQPFVLVSTGLVGRDTLQQEAINLGATAFIALSRSTSIPVNGNLDLIAKKKRSTPSPSALIIGVGLLSLVALSVVSLMSYSNSLKKNRELESIVRKLQVDVKKLEKENSSLNQQGATLRERIAALERENAALKDEGRPEDAGRGL